MTQRTRKKNLSPPPHSLIRESRRRLLALRGEGEWKNIAEKSGLSYRTVCSIAQGARREMTFTREARLAEALGVRVGFDLR